MAKTISVTNDGGLTDPANISFTAVAAVYTLTGPSTGTNGTVSTNFTVALPSGAVVIGALTVVPNDSGGGGSFTPTSVNLTTAGPSATFTYTPVTTGAKTIRVTNSGGLTNPSPVIYTVSTPTYTLSGPSSGPLNVASTNFTVTLPAGVAGTVIVTPNDSSGGGAFTPTSLSLVASGSGTFTYTPATTGTKTIGTTNSGSLTDPASLSFVSGLVDGNPVSSWLDSSGHGNHATNTGSGRPTFKTNIINGKPIVRWTTAGASILNLTTQLTGTAPWCLFAVQKQATSATANAVLAGNGTTNAPYVVEIAASIYGSSRSVSTSVTNPAPGTFQVITVNATDASHLDFYINGTLTTGGAPVANVNTGNFYRMADGGEDGDTAEVVASIGSVISSTERANIEKSLGTKYAISVAGGTAADPSTLTGLAAWWKADSLG